MTASCVLRYQALSEYCALTLAAKNAEIKRLQQLLQASEQRANAAEALVELFGGQQTASELQLADRLRIEQLEVIASAAMRRGGTALRDAVIEALLIVQRVPPAHLTHAAQLSNHEGSLHRLSELEHHLLSDEKARVTREVSCIRATAGLL